VIFVNGARRAHTASESIGHVAPDHADTPLPPIFIGGTGRSGTTILGRLLGAQREYQLIPLEAKFHCHPHGLPGVLRGVQTPETFAATVVREWFCPDGKPKLSWLLDRDSLDAALERFVRDAGEDRVGAGRSLVQEIFGGYTRNRGGRGWIEMTPVNAMHGAPYLAELFPELRFLYIMRDGRDVVSSLIGVGWMEDVLEALSWWEDRMLRSHQMCGALPEGSLHVLRFERLLVEDRRRGYEDLLAFLAWSEDPHMRDFFERQMPAEKAHVGRWRTHLSQRQQALLVGEYPDTLARLRAAGVPTP
jgi:Sulfotransferase family